MPDGRLPRTPTPNDAAVKVVLVDDETLALEYIRSLIPWERHGYVVAGSATNGRSGLRLCEELCPQIMIVDIRMPVMDGLALIRSAAEKQTGVQFIVMSAYEDFHYARQALALGNVSSYLLKHEADASTLLQELEKAKDAWIANERRRRSRMNERFGDALLGRGVSPETEEFAAKPPLALLLLQADVPFVPVSELSLHGEWRKPVKWELEVSTLLFREPAWQCMRECAVSPAQYVVLLTLRNSCTSIVPESLEALAAGLQTAFAERCSRSFSLYYALQTTNGRSLTGMYAAVSSAASHAVFCGRGSLVNADALPLPPAVYDEAPRPVQLGPLREEMSSDRPDEAAEEVRRLFGSVRSPYWNLRRLYDLIGALNALLQERRMKSSLAALDSFDPFSAEPLFDVEGICERHAGLFREAVSESAASRGVPAKLAKALRYIHERYRYDMCIDDVARATGLSASYLHQMFKREMGRTFLDYLTELRVEQAKRILRTENAKMFDVASRVGYRSPQHFTQVFKKATGILPHQYREGGGA